MERLIDCMMRGWDDEMCCDAEPVYCYGPGEVDEIPGRHGIEEMMAEMLQARLRCWVGYLFTIVEIRSQFCE